MKRLSMLGVVLVLLAVMVSSASAHDIQHPANYPYISAGGAVSAENVIVLPPTLPEEEASSAGGANHVVIYPPTEPESGKATPILF